MVAVAAWIPATAQADEGIGSFKTALVEANTPLGEVVASGVVQAEPSGEGFMIETSSGSIDAVKVEPSTTYSKLGVESPTLGEIAEGDYVGVSGTLFGSTVTAKSVVITTPQAGGHPDLITSFSLQSTGAPEAAQNVIFNAPTGVFGNPRAITRCPAAEFAHDQCPPDSQAGLITIRADYKGNPDYLLGTAPIFSLVTGSEETARFSFVVPVLDIPIAIPVQVRTTSDYGLRFTVSDITQLTPLASAKLAFWGFPAEASHNRERFPIGKPGNPTGCPGEEGTACLTKPTEASITPQPLIDNPTVCTAQRPTSTLEVETYADPDPPVEGKCHLPPDRRLRERGLQARPPGFPDNE